MGWIRGMRLMCSMGWLGTTDRGRLLNTRRGKAGCLKKDHIAQNRVIAMFWEPDNACALLKNQY